jgi:hypothetical protein
MSVADILTICERRGIEVVLLPDGSTVLRGKTSQATPELMASLRRYKAAIVAHLADESKKNAPISI